MWHSRAQRVEEGGGRSGRRPDVAVQAVLPTLPAFTATLPVRQRVPIPTPPTPPPTPIHNRPSDWWRPDPVLQRPRGLTATSRREPADTPPSSRRHLPRRSLGVRGYRHQRLACAGLYGRRRGQPATACGVRGQRCAGHRLAGVRSLPSRWYGPELPPSPAVSASQAVAAIAAATAAAAPCRAPSAGSHRAPLRPRSRPTRAVPLRGWGCGTGRIGRDGLPDTRPVPRRSC